MARRGLTARIYFFAFVISALLFTVGIVLGWHMGSAAVAGLSGEMDELRWEEQSLELLLLMDSSNDSVISCSFYGTELGRFIYETEQFGDKLAYLEGKKGKLDPEVMALKSDYASMQLRNYFLHKRMEEKCGSWRIPVIYFYSNIDYDPAEDEAPVFSAVEGDYEFIVYHFDVNADSPVVRALIDSYGVREHPTLVVAGEKHEGFVSEQELRSALASAAGNR